LPEPLHHPVASQRSVGLSILALLLGLVALLGAMLAGAQWLMGQVDGHTADPWIVGLGLAGGLAYAVLAWSVLTLRPWSRPLSVVLLILVFLAGLLDLERGEVMALGTVLTILLAASVNLVVVMVVHLPEYQALCRRRSR